ncbi:hypothetical protein MANY_30970 [Mycolicibacterium anyangense]|uniref:Core-binding (CB) domain-containing protein n=1 Tax=Mycolicibacterium anyangense TaxID=1431246 RepID=A0A6N4W704_9MYCO|nr:hypothetical protein [Mycolicibacterium anyangense]BBZ77760.1 hypothetical protein MANY_30970 [Mycolicibacterium anyangense]
MSRDAAVVNYGRYPPEGEKLAGATSERQHRHKLVNTSNNCQERLSNTAILPAMTTHTTGLADWEVWQVAQRLSRRTIDERLRVIRQCHIDTGVQPISIDAPGVVRWIADHEYQWGDSTVCTYTSYLSAWFKWLQVTDRRADNPMIKVGTPRTPDREPRPITDAEVVKLLQTRMWTSTRRMILLALLAGLEPCISQRLAW